MPCAPARAGKQVKKEFFFLSRGIFLITKMDEVARCAYFADRLASTARHVSARSVGGKGLGLFATASIEEGAVILQDEPLCWAPESPPGEKNCLRCGRFLGSAGTQVRRLAEEHGVNAQSLPEELPLLGSEIFTAAVWDAGCSQDCVRQIRRARVGEDDAAWVKLERKLRGDQFLILAAQLVRQAVRLYAAASPFESKSEAHLRPMRALASPAACQGATSRAELRSSLRAVRACFSVGLLPPDLDAQLSSGLWTQCVGAVRANAIRVAVPSPLVPWMDAVQQLEPGSADRRMLVEKLWPLLQAVQQRRGAGETDGETDGKGSSEEGGEESEGSSDGEDDDEEMFFSWGCRRGEAGISSCIFKPHEGTAVYPVVSLMNHSCTPNCHVVYLSSNTAVIVACCDIAAGEELCIQYVPVEGPVAQRQEELERRYGFRCSCPVCHHTAGGGGGKRRTRGSVDSAQQPAAVPRNTRRHEM